MMDDRCTMRRLRFSDRPSRILVADHDRDMRDLIAVYLRKDGHDVSLAQDGGDLVARLAQATSAYDVVISDIRMPVFTGTYVLEGLRRVSWTTPMILMTAFGDPDARAFVERHNAILFDKPFDIDDLRTAVLHLANRRQELPPRPLRDGASMLSIVASCESALDAWSLRWSLGAEGIASYTGGRDVYVVAGDAPRARAILTQLPDQRASLR
jgi:DNA-binding NtrC family response regulator